MDYDYFTEWAKLVLVVSGLIVVALVVGAFCAGRASKASALCATGGGAA